MGVLDFGAVARLAEGALPLAMGSLIRIAAIEDDEQLLAGLRDEGFIKDRVTIDPALLLDYLSPFVEPTQVERFKFSREWMQSQFQRVNNPRDPAYTLALKINLPPSYLLIHRTWLGAIGILSQLGAEVPFRAILTESLPGLRRGLTRSEDCVLGRQEHAGRWPEEVPMSLTGQCRRRDAPDRGARPRPAVLRRASRASLTTVATATKSSSST